MAKQKIIGQPYTIEREKKEKKPINTLDNFQLSFLKAIESL